MLGLLGLYVRPNEIVKLMYTTIERNEREAIIKYFSHVQFIHILIAAYPTFLFTLFCPRL